jgi:uncharacterized membrane protein YeaQ/YmgE (transglycosylase-associated protein family)
MPESVGGPVRHPAATESEAATTDEGPTDHVAADGRSRRRPSGAAADAAVVLGSMAVLGLVCGVLWWLLVEPAEFTKLESGGAMGEVELGRRFAADGWYVVLAAVAGLLAGVALTWWRSRDALLTAALLLVGAVVAAVLMEQVGQLLGPPDPRPVLAAAEVGAKVPTQLEVDAFTVYLTWPVAVLAGALVVLWGRLPDAEE